MMRRTVLRRKAGAIHAENHGQILKRGVVHDTVVRALEEGRIDGTDGMVAHRGHAARE